MRMPYFRPHCMLKTIDKPYEGNADYGNLRLEEIFPRCSDQEWLIVDGFDRPESNRNSHPI